MSFPGPACPARRSADVWSRLRTVWNTIRAPLIAVIEEDRVKRAAEKLSKRQEGRQKALLPINQSLLDAQPTDLARATFPPIADFVTFESVRSLWEHDEVVIDEATLEAAKPAVVAEANKFVRVFKIATFSKLARAHADSKVVVDSCAPTTYHTAPNHSATDVEELSTRVTSAFPCPISSCIHFETFPSIFVRQVGARLGLQGRCEGLVEASPRQLRRLDPHHLSQPDQRHPSRPSRCHQ